MADKKKEGSLQKLVIRAFKDKGFKQEDESLKFITPINPETFTRTSHLELDKATAHGKSSTDPKYKSSAPEEVKIEFTLDGTRSLEGYVKDYKEMEVTTQIKKFNDCVYNVREKTHRPNFLIIHWGSDLDFQCVLSHLDISYSLFKPDGNPLRAKITATFIHFETPQAEAQRTRKASPDLTHFRTVKAGDRLDNMTFNIYNDPGFYMQVAKINRLSNLRILNPGEQLRFPPVEKNKN